FWGGACAEVKTDARRRALHATAERAAVFVDGSPVFETTDGFQGSVIARYAETGSPLLSGYLIGENYLHGKAAALDVQLGDGHVVLLGFRPTWRGQPLGTFRVLLNAAIFARCGIPPYPPAAARPVLIAWSAAAPCVSSARNPSC